MGTAWITRGLPSPVIGWIMDAFEGGVGAGVIMNYLPYFLELPMNILEVPGSFIYESGGKYTTDGFQGFLRGTSKLPPLPFLGIMKSTSPQGYVAPLSVPNSFIYVPTPISIMNQLCQFLLAGESQKRCQALVGHDDNLQQFSDSLDALIGAPSSLPSIAHLVVKG